MSVTKKIIGMQVSFCLLLVCLLVAEPASAIAQDVGGRDYERRIQEQNARKRQDRTDAERRAAEEGARRALARRQKQDEDDDEPIPADDVDAIATGLNPVPDKVVPVWAIHNVTFSPDGTSILAGLGTGDVHVWSLADRSVAKFPKLHTEWTFATVFDADGKTVFSAGGDNQVHRWSGPDFDSKLQSYAGHTGDVHALAVSNDNRRLVSAGDDMTPIVWDVESGEIIRQLDKHPRQIPALALSPDGTKVATACRDGMIRTFAIETGELLLSHQGHEGDALSVRFTADGSRLVSGGYDGVVTVYDSDMGHLVAKVTATEEAIVCVDVSDDGDAIVVATNEEIIRLMLEGDDVLKDVYKADLGANEQFSFVRFAPDEGVVAASTTGQRVFVLESNLSEAKWILRDSEFNATELRDRN